MSSKQGNRGTGERRVERDRRVLSEFDLRESLSLEFDPVLYSADQVLMKHASQLAHSYDGDSHKPAAILVPGPETMSWHAGFLAKHFRLFLWAGEDDSAADELAVRYQAKVFSGEIPTALSEGIDFILFTDYGWPAAAELAHAVREAEHCLAPGGKVVFVLNVDPTGHVAWSDGTQSSWDELSRGAVFRLAAPASSQLVLHEEIRSLPDCGITAFLSRHKQFFGRDARAYCEMRVGSSEFQSCLARGGGAGVLAWEAE